MTIICVQSHRFLVDGWPGALFAGAPRGGIGFRQSLPDIVSLVTAQYQRFRCPPAAPQRQNRVTTTGLHEGSTLLLFWGMTWAAVEGILGRHLVADRNLV